MIFFLTWFLMFLAPANILIFCAVLMMGSSRLTPKLELPQKLFMLWIIWAFWGCVSSVHPIPAFVGNIVRGEGWLLWLVAARLAWFYWATQDGFDFMTACSMAFMFIMVMLYFLVGHNPIADMPLAAFSAIAAVLLWTVRPDLSTLAIPTLLIANNRTAILAAVSGIVVYEIFSRSPLISLMRTSVALGALILIIPFTPLAHKFSALDPGTFGLGARASFLQQAWEISKINPARGVGLDVISAYLKEPVMLQSPKGVPDRVHNIMYEIILQTGWVGYFLSLLCFGAAIGYAVKYPSNQNSACLAILTSWVVFSFINPPGSAPHVFALMAIFGFQKYE